MAITRISQSTVKEGLEKFNNFIGGSPFVSVPTSFESIATIVVGSPGTARILFTDIPSTYDHLQLRLNLRSNRNANVEGSIVRLNGSSSNIYAFRELYGTGSAVAGGGAGSTTNGNIPYPTGGSATANTFGGGIIDFFDYSNTSKKKVWFGMGGFENNSDGLVTTTSSLWNSAAAITSIFIEPAYGSQWVQYSTAALYGIKTS